MAMTPEEREKAFEEIGQDALLAVAEFLSGKATLEFSRPAGVGTSVGWVVRLVRAPKP
jgi:hypothetical protein